MRGINGGWRRVNMEKYARKGVISDERVNMLEQKHGNSGIERKVCVCARACVRTCACMV